MATITATLSNRTDQPVRITLAVETTSTVTDSDYSLSGLEINIPAGSTTGQILLSAVQDTEVEGNETLTLEIVSTSGAQEAGVQSLGITIEDDDVPAQFQVILNEILYDPSNSGLAGDANGDGVYAQSEDEFLEFVNLSTQSIDLSGYKIYDAENLAINTPNHTIPANTIIGPGEALVVFGGGTPTGTFGGATVQTSTSGDLNLNNSGDVFYLHDPGDQEVLQLDIEPLSNNPNESYTRDPDLTGDFVQHSSVVPGVLFSPGTKSDGTPF